MQITAIEKVAKEDEHPSITNFSKAYETQIFEEEIQLTKKSRFWSSS